MKEALRMLVANEDLVTTDMVEGALASKRMDGAPEALTPIAVACLGDRAADGAAEDLASASAPVLTIWGAEDRVIPAPAGGGATIIDGAGHVPQMEAATKVLQAVAQHLEAAE